MADLTFGDVLLIGGVATAGLALLSYWWSGVMVRRGWSWQVRKVRPKRNAAAASAAPPKTGRPAKAERPAKTERAAKPARPTKSARPAKPARPDKPARGGKADGDGRSKTRRGR